MNNTNQQNQEPRKHALITAEQEALMRAFEQAKKMQYGEFTIHLQGGNIVRYEIKKSESLTNKKLNAESLKDAASDMDDLETIAI